jgi:hypothetical protein
MPRRLLGLCLAVLTLPGCGEADAPPAAPAAAPVGQEVGAVELLQRMVRSVANGPAAGTKELGLDAAHLRELLWPDLAAPGAHAAAMSHQRATHFAGTTAAQLLADPGARETIAQTDPFGLRIHDLWLKAAQQGPDAYRIWCADEATELFRRREEEAQRMFDRPVPAR